ncbi:hypothetical protein [Streptomyces sp. CBMA29]|uniref:hypothetical protein n=1 Tax=Streptomyces sp. CBMA29 TaxID=1896314 RepID=UPI001661F198|nr:hypothetical protein [Streptomyces sp. CBMA29]
MIVEDSRTRDPFGIALAIILLLVAAGLISAAVVNKHAWWWLVVPGALIAIVALPGLVKESTPQTPSQGSD